MTTPAADRPAAGWGDRLRQLAGGAAVVAVLGIGNELMGDDAAGVLTVRELERTLPAAVRGGRVRLYECATTPENFTGALERLKPDLVLMIDAADLGAAVGEVRLLDPASMGSMMHSTHTMPLSFLADYIARTSGAQVVALGIQAGQIQLDRPVSPAVCRGVERAARAVVASLG